MRNVKLKVTDRILAFVMVMMLVISLVPTSIFASPEYGKYTVTVKDESGNVIEGANLSYEISFSDGTEAFSGTGTSDEYGVVSVDLSAYTTISDTNKASLKYSLSKEGYVSQMDVVVAEVITTVDGNYDVTMVAEITEPEESTVTVEVMGDAIVKLNDIEQKTITVANNSDVKVEIIPAEGTYIKVLTVGNEQKMVNHGESYTETLKVDGNVEVKATVVKEYRVTAKYVTNGTIQLNGKQVSSLIAEENQVVKLSVRANDGYGIASVSINGVLQSDIVSNVEEYTKNITITEDSEIIATFVKIYKVTVSYDDNGVVNTSPETVGGTVAVNPGDKVTVEATPKEGYRVSKVLINGQADRSVKGENNEAYSKNLKVDKDYKIEITFAPNQYKVNVNITGNGKVEVEKTVNYGETQEIIIVPEAGYSIASATVNGTDITENLEESEDGYTYTVKAIEADINISVTFEENNPADFSDLKFDTPIRSDGNTYVYANDDTVTFTTGTTGKTYGIRLFKLNERGKEEQIGNKGAKSVLIKETSTITGIQLRYKDDNERRASWHTVDGITKENPLKIVFDESVPTVEWSCAEPNGNEYYNSDVVLDVTVSDPGDYSGIKSVEYEIFIPDKEKQPQKGTLYSDDEEIPKKENKCRSSITVNAELFNSDGVAIKVKVKDWAENEEEYTKNINIDSISPTVEISFDNNNVKNYKYFDAKRVATVKVTDRMNHFEDMEIVLNPKDENGNVIYPQENLKDQFAVNGIVIYAKDGEGNFIDTIEVDGEKKPAVIFPESYIEWEHDEKTVEPTHTSYIEFNADANYEWFISYTDKADNKADSPSVNQENKAIYDFVVDTTVPYGTVFAIREESPNNPKESSELVTDLTFGFWSQKKITVEATSGDDTSPIESIEYYKAKSSTPQDNTVALDEDALANVTWEEFAGLEITDNEQCTVYLRITDMAGNYKYISTNGLIVDNQKPVEEAISPEITINPAQPINGIYNDNVNVAITVTDPTVGGTYSGLKTVRYEVKNMGVTTQEGVLYQINESDDWRPTQKELVPTFSGTITVESATNNSNEIEVIVYAVDNAENPSSNKIDLKIDTTAPTIDISYDNNTADNSKYFKANRTATITVTERNFDAKDVLTKITNTDGTIPSIGAWQKVEGTGNKDNTKWITTVTYSADGDYTFDIGYTDLAGNACSGAQYGTSVAPTDFTVDKTLPVINVSYDNNSAQNGKYFKDSRTATVTIKEHNFDVERVKFTQTASKNGSSISIPAASWTHSGDTHTARFSYAADGDYTFDVSATDMAGNESEAANYGNSVAGKEFTVDQTIEKPSVTGVENGKAYKDEVIPKISFQDINYDSHEIKLVRTRKGEKNVDVTNEFIKTINKNSQGASGVYDTFAIEPENDGIYTLTVKMVDKAGNEETEEITFTVNRFGSVYEYDDYLVSLISNGGSYEQTIEGDLIITEYNADRLVGNSLVIEITRDGKPLDNVIYDVTPGINDKVKVGESGWYQYQYTISKDNFKLDGVYKISISSKDASGNSPENSNYEDKNILFRVDSTLPEITSIVGLEESIINAPEVKVNYTVYDTIGLKSIKIMVNGKQLGETITDFGDDLNNYTGFFMLSESKDIQNVRIIVEDLSGNITDTDAEEFVSAYTFNKAVTVSTKWYIRWFANKPLFWGTVIGGAALLAVLFFIILAKRKKDEEEEA